MGRSKLKQLIIFLPDGTRLRGRGPYADFISAQHEKVFSSLVAIGACTYEEKPQTVRVQVLGSEIFFRLHLTERLAEAWEEIMRGGPVTGEHADPAALELDVVQKRLAKGGRGPKAAQDQAELTIQEVWKGL